MIHGLRPEAGDANVPELDVSGTSFISGVTNFTAGNFYEACRVFNLPVDHPLGRMIMHPVLYFRLSKNDLVDYLSEGDCFRGMIVQVNSNIPLTRGVTIVEFQLAGKTMGLLKVREH